MSTSTTCKKPWEEWIKIHWLRLLGVWSCFKQLITFDSFCQNAWSNQREPGQLNKKEWRVVTADEFQSIAALPKNDESVEWRNGEAWDLVPTPHLQPGEVYRTCRK